MGGTASTAKFSKVEEVEGADQRPPPAPVSDTVTPSADAGTVATDTANQAKSPTSARSKAKRKDGEASEFDPNSIFGRLNAWFGEASKNMDKVPGFNLDGEVALNLLVEVFYNKLLDDDDLAPFFTGVSMETLRRHQFEFLRNVLSQGSFKYSGKPMRVGHSRLFEIGLNETHFDMVAGHLVTSMKELAIPEDLINDVVAVVVPLREVFEDEAKKQVERASKKKKV